MSNFLIAIFAIMITLIALLIGYMIYFGQRFLKLQEKKMNQEKTENAQLTIEELVKAGRISPELANLAEREKAQQSLLAKVCQDHPDTPAYKKCSISGEYLCEKCVTSHDNIWVGKKYVDILLDGNWQELLMIPDRDENEGQLTKILDKKNKLWQSESVPVIVQGHYKINVESDDIESYTVVMVRPEDKERLKSELSFYN